MLLFWARLNSWKSSLETTGKVKAKPEVENKPKVKLSTDCSLGGKIAGKECVQGKF
jgi:hypothetical protein